MVSSLWACDGQMRDDCAEAITTLTSVTALSREPLSVRVAVQQLLHLVDDVFLCRTTFQKLKKNLQKAVSWF